MADKKEEELPTVGQKITCTTQKTKLSKATKLSDALYKNTAHFVQEVYNSKSTSCKYCEEGYCVYYCETESKSCGQ